PSSVVDLSGLQGPLGIVQPGPNSFYAGTGATILIPNVTALDQANLTIIGSGQISTAQLTGLTRSQVVIDGATTTFLGVTDTTGSSFQYRNGGSGLFQPTADLMVSGVFPPATALANQPVQMIWEVTNIGTALTNGSWVDALLLSTDGLPGNDLFVGS